MTPTQAHLDAARMVVRSIRTAESEPTFQTGVAECAIAQALADAEQIGRAHV